MCPSVQTFREQVGLCVIANTVEMLRGRGTLGKVYTRHRRFREMGVILSLSVETQYTVN